jgi:cytoskeletal protein CcmA (bactofilin family)
MGVTAFLDQFNPVSLPNAQRVLSMFKKSDSFDAGDYKHNNPEPVYAESSSAKHILSGKEGVRAMVGASVRSKGELSGGEDLVIQGHVDGTFELKRNNLTVGMQGSGKANSQAKIITIYDIYMKVRWTVTCSARSESLSSTQVMSGNIVAPRVSLEDGTKIKGSIKMEPKALRPAAQIRNSAARRKPTPQLTRLRAKTT